MSAARKWLEDRLGQAPRDLLETMVSALPGTEPSVADELGRAAILLYARVAAGSGEREDALPLLAADALLTHAFEAAAENGGENEVEAIAGRWGVSGALSHLA